MTDTSSKNIKAIIFDMDGTLIDSEPNYAVSDCLLVAHYGGQMTLEEHSHFVGMGMKTFINYLIDKYKITDSFDQIEAKYKELYLTQAHNNTPVFPEMKKFVQNLHNKKDLKLAVASGTHLPIIHKMMEEADMFHYFDQMVSADEVEHGKPEPDIFLETARRLNVKPDECVVLEDSYSGMKSALNAGMHLIAIPGEYFPKEKSAVLDDASLVYKSMDDFCSQKTEQWLFS